MANPQQGWYPDPQDPQKVRWWDGKNWTEHTQLHPHLNQRADSGIGKLPEAADSLTSSSADTVLVSADPTRRNAPAEQSGDSTKPASVASATAESTETTAEPQLLQAHSTAVSADRAHRERVTEAADEAPNPFASPDPGTTAESAPSAQTPQVTQVATPAEPAERTVAEPAQPAVAEPAEPAVAEPAEPAAAEVSTSEPQVAQPQAAVAAPAAPEATEPPQPAEPLTAQPSEVEQAQAQASAQAQELRAAAQARVEAQARLEAETQERLASAEKAQQEAVAELSKTVKECESKAQTAEYELHLLTEESSTEEATLAEAIRLAARESHMAEQEVKKAKAQLTAANEHLTQVRAEVKTHAELVEQAEAVATDAKARETDVTVKAKELLKAADQKRSAAVARAKEAETEVLLARTKLSKLAALPATAFLNGVPDVLPKDQSLPPLPGGDTLTTSAATPQTSLSSASTGSADPAESVGPEVAPPNAKESTAAASEEADHTFPVIGSDAEDVVPFTETVAFPVDADFSPRSYTLTTTDPVDRNDSSLTSTPSATQGSDDVARAQSVDGESSVEESPSAEAPVQANDTNDDLAAPHSDAAADVIAAPSHRVDDVPASPENEPVADDQPATEQPVAEQSIDSASGASSVMDSISGSTPATNLSEQELDAEVQDVMATIVAAEKGAQEPLEFGVVEGEPDEPGAPTEPALTAEVVTASAETAAKDAAAPTSEDDLPAEPEQAEGTEPAGFSGALPLGPLAGEDLPEDPLAGVQPINAFGRETTTDEPPAQDAQLPDVPTVIDEAPSPLSPAASLGSLVTDPTAIQPPDPFADVSLDQVTDPHGVVTVDPATQPTDVPVESLASVTEPQVQVEQVETGTTPSSPSNAAEGAAHVDTPTEAMSMDAADETQVLDPSALPDPSASAPTTADPAHDPFAVPMSARNKVVPPTTEDTGYAAPGGLTGAAVPAAAMAAGAAAAGSAAAGQATPAASAPEAMPAEVDYEEPTMELAGAAGRLAAQVMDWFILSIVMTGAFFVTGINFTEYALLAQAPDNLAKPDVLDQVWKDLGILAAISFVVPFVYDFFLIKLRGKTLGMSIMSIKVVPNDRLGAVSWVSSFGRAFVKYPFSAAFWPLLLPLLGFLWCLWDGERQCWHDKMGNTAVVLDD